MTDAIKVLVLGASGQVGSEIAAAFTRVSAARRAGVFSIINATRNDCDVGDPNAIEAVIDLSLIHI